MKLSALERMDDGEFVTPWSRCLRSRSTRGSRTLELRLAYVETVSVRKMKNYWDFSKGRKREGTNVVYDSSFQ